MGKVALGFILALVAVSGAAHASPVVWDSYSDPAHIIQSDLFVEYNCLVHMQAVGLPPVNKRYSVEYYDALDTLLQVEAGLSQEGSFISIIRPSGFPNSASGIWRAELYRTSPRKSIATDTFTVESSAIPEFPIAIAGIGVVGLCALAYIWMRKRFSSHSI